MPKIIGISGGKGVGKDTVASFLTGVHNFTRLSFGDPIKEALTTIFEVDRSLFWDEKKKEVPSDLLCGRTPRYLMQTLGTEWGRDLVSETLWVDLLVAKMQRQSYMRSGFVIPDVRFPSEAQAIRYMGGTIWHVHRKETPYAADTHASEMGISDSWIDAEIDNNGNMESLRLRIGDLLVKK